MELNNCECGFSCKKLYYFTVHKKICKLENNDNKQSENLEIDSITLWWNKYSDRVFMKELYPKIGKYLKHIFMPKILDIGFENFNIINKDLLNNPQITYFQLEPFIENKIYKNDFLLECKVTELIHYYPEYKKYFQIILDFGVLGAPSISKNWDKQEITNYIKNIYSVLRDDGIYILKIDLPYFDMEEYKLNFETMIYP